jgi:hypothetical protein
MTLPPPFTLVGDRISHDTHEALLQLQRMSRGRSARLIGIAFAGMILKPDGRHYFTNAAGELYRNPDVARGYVAQLHDCLGQLSRGEQPFGWQ